MYDWSQWQEQLLTCRGCILSDTRTNIVCGKGNKKASVMLLGEAPGKQEDLCGEPFAGQAGRLLHSFLAESGIDENNLYIGNRVKCRPVRTAKNGKGFANRKPKADELKSCATWLEEEIKLLAPKVIVTLGAVPLSFFMPESFKMADVHGKKFFHDEWQAYIFPLYHPAAMIYDAAKKKIYSDDLAALKKWLQEVLV